MNYNPYSSPNLIPDERHDEACRHWVDKEKGTDDIPF